MSKQATKTNNDERFLEVKIQLRLMSLPNKSEINVLECFGGEGVLWKEVKKRTDKKINILSIDKNDYKKINLKGENVKFIKSMDLSMFDVIDLDAWGSPSSQLDVIYEKGYSGIIHCTFIQSMMGCLNHNILIDYGYSKNMIKKCPTLFSKNGYDKILNYISKRFNVKNITEFSHNNKHYFWLSV